MSQADMGMAQYPPADMVSRVRALKGLLEVLPRSGGRPRARLTEEASVELAEGGRPVVFGVGPAQAEGRRLPLLHGSCSQGFDQRHQRDAGLPDVGLEHALVGVELGCGGQL